MYIYVLPAPGIKKKSMFDFTTKFRLMSSDPSRCSECGGKFGPGPVCFVCGALLRLKEFLLSGRCPSLIAPGAGGAIREAHRCCLEEADRYWASAPPEVCSHPSTTPKAAPPTASGRAPGVEEKPAEPKEEGPVKKEKSPCPKPEVRERATRVEEAPRRRSRSRRRKKEKEEKHREQKETRRTHRSPVPRVEPVRDSSHRSSPREKKHRRDPSPAEEEESEESPAVPSHSGLVRDSGRSVPRPPSHSPPPHRRAPRSPSRSPENRSKWKGPIRALPRRQEWERPQGRKHKKNKGLKKKARPREFKARGFWPKRR